MRLVCAGGLSPQVSPRRRAPYLPATIRAAVRCSRLPAARFYSVGSRCLRGTHRAVPVLAFLGVPVAHPHSTVGEATPRSVNRWITFSVNSSFTTSAIRGTSEEEQT